MKYVVVQPGFLTHFLCGWRDGVDQWDCHCDRALVLDGPMARGIAAHLNARRPNAPVPVTVDTVKWHIR